MDNLRERNALPIRKEKSMNAAKRSTKRSLTFETLDHRNLLACDSLVVVGDANQDGYFDTGDLVTVFQSGKYETGLAATPQQGDFNCDGVFDSSDFVFALQNGNYENQNSVRDLAAFDLDFEVIKQTKNRRYCADYRRHSKHRHIELRFCSRAAGCAAFRNP